MELQFQKTAIKFLNCAVREVQNAELTQEIRLPDGMPDIGRVLASWGQVILRSKEWRADTVTVTGGLMVWVLYAPEDGTDPRSVDGWLPFQMKWNLASGDREGPVRVLPLLRFVDSRSVSARKFMIRAGIGAMGEAFYPVETDIFSPVELPEDVQTLCRTYPVRLPKESGEKMFYMDEDISVPGSSAPEKILSYTISPQIQEKKVMSNKVVFRGTAELHLIYRGEDGRIHTWDASVPFSQYADLEGEYGTDAQMDVQMGITSLELDMNEQGQLRLKCGMLAQYLVDDRQLVELTEDAYSPRRDLEIQSQALHLPAILENRRDLVPAQQILTGQSGEMADVQFLPDFPRCMRTENGMEAQLSGIFQILCYGEDNMLRSGTARWETSYKLPAGTESHMDMMVLPKLSGQARTDGEDIVLSGEVNLQIMTTAEHGLTMITGLELGDLKEADPGRPALILCRPEGEELWNIAKRCGSTVAAIRQANHLQQEPSADQMLLIPVD